MSRHRFGRRTVETSHEEKVLFEQAGITKGEVIAHYERVAGAILPHLRERPLVLQRFPDGIDAEGFYQKQVPGHFPDWIRRVGVRVKGTGERQDLVVCETKATLAFLADQAAITLHPWLSRSEALERPDVLVIDLDPPDGDDFEPVRRAARQARELLRDDLELPVYLKLTGSRGVHLVVPLDRGQDFDAVRAFARDAMDLLAARHPGELTTEQRKAERAGRLYLDCGRNAYAQTAVAPWSLRALPGAPVAAPIAWDELEGIGPRDVRVGDVERRLAGHADPWAGWRRHARSIGPARERLERLRSRA